MLPSFSQRILAVPHIRWTFAPSFRENQEPFEEGNAASPAARLPARASRLGPRLLQHQRCSTSRKGFLMQWQRSTKGEALASAGYLQGSQPLAAASH